MQLSTQYYMASVWSKLIKLFFKSHSVQILYTFNTFFFLLILVEMIIMLACSCTPSQQGFCLRRPYIMGTYILKWSIREDSARLHSFINLLRVACLPILFMCIYVYMLLCIGTYIYIYTFAYDTYTWVRYSFQLKLVYFSFSTKFTVSFENDKFCQLTQSKTSQIEECPSLYKP